MVQLSCAPPCTRLPVTDEQGELEERTLRGRDDIDHVSSKGVDGGGGDLHNSVHDGGAEVVAAVKVAIRVRYRPNDSLHRGGAEVREGLLKTHFIFGCVGR